MNWPYDQWIATGRLIRDHFPHPEQRSSLVDNCTLVKSFLTNIIQFLPPANEVAGRYCIHRRLGVCPSFCPQCVCACVCVWCGGKVHHTHHRIGHMIGGTPSLLNIRPEGVPSTAPLGIRHEGIPLPSLDVGPGEVPPAIEIWWPSLETCSNLFT